MPALKMAVRLLSAAYGFLLFSTRLSLEHAGPKGLEVVQAGTAPAGQRLEPNDGKQLFKALFIKADGADKIKDDKLRIYSRMGRLSIHGPQERWCRIKRGYFRCPVPVF
jgi:hypothetical protein